MLNRFSAAARQAVTAAAAEAERRGDRRIGTEHLLLGVLQLPDPWMAVTAGGAGRLPFTSGARNVVERTLREAVQRRSRRLEPRRLLLALLACDPPDPAGVMLARLEVDRDTVRRQLDAAA